jgi:hypothetical protein
MALKKGKIAPKEDAVSCTLMRMRDNTFLICAHVNATKAAAMVKEARNNGGKVAAAGRLFSGESGTTFEVDEGNLSIKQKFAAAAAALKSPMNVVVIAAPGAVLECDPAADDAPTAPTAPADVAPQAASAAAPAPTSDIAAVKAAAAKIIPVVQQALKVHPDKKNEVMQPLLQCQQHIKDNNAAGAEAQLAELGNRLKSLGPAPARPAPAAAPQPAPTAPTAAPVAASDKNQRTKARWKQILTEINPLADSMIAGGTLDADDWSGRFDPIQDSYNAGERTTAVSDLEKYLNELKAKKAAGSAPQPKPQAQTAAPDDEFKELYNALLETIPADLRELRAANAGVANEVEMIVDGAAAYAAKGKFKEAFESLNRAADQIAKTKGAARAQEAVNVIPEGKVAEMRQAIERARIRWDHGVLQATAEMKKVQEAYHQVHPQLASALGSILDGYQKELLAFLASAQKAQSGPDVDHSRADLLKKAADLKAQVAADKLLAHLDALPLGSVKLQTTIDQALTEIQSYLTA